MAVLLVKVGLIQSQADRLLRLIERLFLVLVDVPTIYAEWRRLVVIYKEGLSNPVRVGLENWMTKLKEYIAADKRAYNANKAPLEMRAKLRGRLEAFKAKALARGLAEDASLSPLAEEAKRLLSTRPTSLAKAAELVTHYDKELYRKLYMQQGRVHLALAAFKSWKVGSWAGF